MAPRENFSGPHISAAFLCEKVLIERDGVSTFVRVVERFSMQRIQIGTPAPDAPVPPPIVQATLVIILKSGDLGAGRFKVTIVFIKPDGSEMNRQHLDVFFGGSDENGVAIISPVMLQAPDEGLHWFDVLFEDQPLTRIPMRIVYPQQMQFIPAPTPRVP